MDFIKYLDDDIRLQPFRNRVNTIQSKFKELCPESSSSIREKYMDTYINRHSHVFDMYECAHAGFLWDMIKPECTKKFYQESHIKKHVIFDREVYLMWDSSFPLLGPLGRSSVFETNVKTIFDHMDLLPQDLYIFEKTYEWTMMNSHYDITGFHEHWIIIDPKKHILKN